MDNVQNEKIRIVGHRWAIDLLVRQQEIGRTPQTLLLVGPPNVGKSTLARYYAQRLNCRATVKPCGNCLSCRKTVSGNHPDIRILDSDNQAIKIDQIRDLQRELSLSPHESQYRLTLLCNFERATISAANALLKTLEEPAPNVVMILTATDPGGLLPTITSRCQVLTLRPLPQQAVLEALQTEWHIPSEQAALLAQLAAGRLGWAVRALEDKEFLARREQHLHQLLNLLRMDRVARLEYAHQVSRKPEITKETLLIWLSVWRDLLLLQSGSQTKTVNTDWQDMLQTIADQINLVQVKEMVSRLRAALTNLERNVNPRLNLEIVLLRLPLLTVSKI